MLRTRKKKSDSWFKAHLKEVILGGVVIAAISTVSAFYITKMLNHFDNKRGFDVNFHWYAVLWHTVGNERIEGSYMIYYCSFTSPNNSTVTANQIDIYYQRESNEPKVKLKLIRDEFLFDQLITIKEAREKGLLHARDHNLGTTAIVVDNESPTTGYIVVPFGKEVGYDPFSMKGQRKLTGEYEVVLHDAAGNSYSKKIQIDPDLKRLHEMEYIQLPVK